MMSKAVPWRQFSRTCAVRRSADDYCPDGTSLAMLAGDRRRARWRSADDYCPDGTSLAIGGELAGDRQPARPAHAGIAMKKKQGWSDEAIMGCANMGQRTYVTHYLRQIRRRSALVESD
jgi:hypothetical protein